MKVQIVKPDGEIVATKEGSELSADFAELIEAEFKLREGELRAQLEREYNDRIREQRDSFEKRFANLANHCSAIAEELVAVRDDAGKFSEAVEDGVRGLIGDEVSKWRAFKRRRQERFAAEVDDLCSTLFRETVKV